jgi:uncharacterized protein YuzE
MKETAIDKLVGNILTEADKYNEDGDVIGIELWNAYKPCVDLSDFVQEANELFKEQIKEAYQQGYNNAYFSRAINKEEYYNQLYENTEKEQFYQTTFTMKESNRSLEELRKVYDKFINSGESIIIYVDKDGNLTQLKDKQ